MLLVHLSLYAMYVNFSFLADEKVTGEVNEPIEPSRPVEEVRQDAYSLPAGFVWCNVDIANETQVCNVYQSFQEVRQIQ